MMMEMVRVAYSKNNDHYLIHIARCIMSAMSGVAVLPYLAPTEKYLTSKADLHSPSQNYQNVIAIVRTACGLDAMIAICMTEVALGFIVSEGIDKLYTI